MKRMLVVFLALVMAASFTACSALGLAAGGSDAGSASLSTPDAPSEAASQASAVLPNEGGETGAGSSDTGDGGNVANQPYGEWVGVWESPEGTMVIRFSHMIDFVLDCYYYYPEDGFGFQINISEDEVDGNYIHSFMIDPAFDYDASYEFTLNGDSFDFVYHYQQNVIEESTFHKTDETDIEGTWKYYWDL